VYRDCLRGIKNRAPALVLCLLESRHIEKGVSALEINSEFRQLLRKALDEWSPALRVAFVLRDMQGLCYDEMATVLKLETTAIKSRLYRARLQLREQISNYFSPSHKAALACFCFYRPVKFSASTRMLAIPQFTRAAINVLDKLFTRSPQAPADSQPRMRRALAN
jgi:Sigma-70, region 4